MQMFVVKIQTVSIRAAEPGAGAVHFAWSRSSV